jgi:benzoyl-CoA reductase subunit BamC
LRTIKTINIDVDKCNGCRACEAICSAFHASPRYSSTNPEKSRIRVNFDPANNIYVPVLAGEYTKSECNGRLVYTIDEKEYNECAFCRASCPSRDLFVDPDSGLPLKCDMCEEETLAEPVCVQRCINDALTYEEKEDVEGQVEIPGDLEVGVETLIEKYGEKLVRETLAKLVT